VADGLYIASFAPTEKGTYDLEITMENDFTDANPGASLTVSSGTTLTVADNRTVPEAATIEVRP